MNIQVNNDHKPKNQQNIIYEKHLNALENQNNDIKLIVFKNSKISKFNINFIILEGKN